MIRILQGDCREVLCTLPDESVHCVVTSPPYFGLRDYGTAKWEGGDAACEHKGSPLISSKSTLAGYTSEDIKLRTFSVPFTSECGNCGARRIDSQIGLEPTPEAYVAELVAVFREVRRVLRKDATCWLNLGDSYAQSEVRHRNKESESSGLQTSRGEWSKNVAQTGRKLNHGLKPKDLIGIPWMVAFALRADGWWLRQDIIWAKPNPMPESVIDRCTKAHEYIFLLTKSERYYFDAAAIAETSSENTHARRSDGENTRKQSNNLARGNWDLTLGANSDSGTRNKRSVWTVATQPYSEAHFATFPPALIEPCILAGCPAKCCAKCGAPWVREVEHPDFSQQPKRQTAKDIRTDRTSAGQAWQAWRNANPSKNLGFSSSCSCDAGTVAGTCLDPFGGAGTTGLVADRLQRNAILIELNADYAAMAERRIFQDAPLLMEAAE